MGPTNRYFARKLALRAALVTAVGFTMGAGGDEDGGRGCAALASSSEAPAMDGTWDVEYDDSLIVEISIGGAVYTEELGGAGGVIEIEHEGLPLSFDVDCSRPEIQCASEVFPAQIEAEHRNPNLPHTVHFTLPTQTCSGTVAAADANLCGAGTDNPDCADVCDGEIVSEDLERTGVISEDGDDFDMLLGASVASNGVNCGLLAVSLVAAEVVSTDPDALDGWQAETMESGTVDIGYAGACLWADDVNMDGELEAAVLSATVKLTTGFKATRR